MGLAKFSALTVGGLTERIPNSIQKLFELSDDVESELGSILQSSNFTIPLIASKVLDSVI